MKTKTKIFIAAIIAIVTIITAVVVAFVYEENFKKTEIYKEQSPNNEYEFVLYQVGAPAWPYGPVKAEIEVLDSEGDTLDKESILIYNDGGPLSERNVDDVRWNDNSVEFFCVAEVSATYMMELD